MYKQGPDLFSFDFADMYSSRGSDSYGQQSYSAQSSYGQNVILLNLHSILPFLSFIEGISYPSIRILYHMLISASPFSQSSSAYPGNSAGVPASSSHLTMGSRHQSILGGPHESEIGGFRAHPAAAQYGGQYGSLYGQSSLSASQQVSGNLLLKILE